MNTIKKIIKSIIPFYSSYTKSSRSTIHNQTYWSYVRFRLSGSCSGGGIIPYIQHVLLRIKGEFLSGAMQVSRARDAIFRELAKYILGTMFGWHRMSESLAQTTTCTIRESSTKSL